MHLKDITRDETSLENFDHLGLRFISFTSDDGIESHKEIIKMRNDPRIRMFMFNDKIITLGEHLDFVSKLKNTKEKMYWAVYDENVFIGSINLIDINTEHRRAKLGIYSNPDKRGYGGRLLQTLKWVAFEKILLNCLRLEVLANNDNAIKFYEKNGFKLEGVLRDFVLRGDEVIDVLVYSMLKREYNESK